MELAGADLGVEREGLGFAVGRDGSLAQVGLERAVSLLSLLEVLGPLLELDDVLSAAVSSPELKRLWHGLLRPVHLHLTDREKLAWLRVLQIALVCIYGKLVIEPEDLCLAQLDLGLFLFLKLA